MPQDWLTSSGSNLQPQDSVPFTLLLQFYFSRIKEEASEHMQNITLMSFSSVLSTGSAETLLCAYLLLEFREDWSFFPPSSQDHSFQCKYQRVINKGGSSLNQGHGITECLVLGGTFGDHLVHVPCWHKACMICKLSAHIVWHAGLNNHLPIMAWKP